jgi:hypothetical protein
LNGELQEGEHPYPTRRLAIGLSRGGEMHVSLPGRGDEPVDELTLEALRSIGEAAIDRMEQTGSDPG